MLIPVSFVVLFPNYRYTPTLTPKLKHYISFMVCRIDGKSKCHVKIILRIFFS